MPAVSRRPVAAPRSMRGGTLVGFMIGLLTGMTIAVVVAVFITRSPVPFVNKTGRVADRPIEPKTAADAPDPNKPLYSKGRPAIPAASAPPPAAPEDRASILERLFGRGSGEPEPARTSTDASMLPDARGTRAPEARSDAADRVSYLLQAGAFRSQPDADAMRAKLALLGFEAKVVSAEVNGQAMYRVRVGPYPQIDDMNRARTRLAENGIEASVVRQR